MDYEGFMTRMATELMASQNFGRSATNTKNTELEGTSKVKVTCLCSYNPIPDVGLVSVAFRIHTHVCIQFIWLEPVASMSLRPSNNKRGFSLDTLASAQGWVSLKLLSSVVLHSI